jgi:hypothetical protein
VRDRWCSARASQRHRTAGRDGKGRDRGQQWQVRRIHREPNKLIVVLDGRKIGNGALAGARQMLLYQQRKTDAERIAPSIEHIELSEEGISSTVRPRALCQALAADGRQLLKTCGHAPRPVEGMHDGREEEIMARCLASKRTHSYTP